MKQQYDFIVVGGGISGVSLAYMIAKQGRKVLILEKSSEMGGAVFSKQKEDFFVEMGAHTCYHSYTSVLKLMRYAELEETVLQRLNLKYFFYQKTFKSLFSQLKIVSLLGSIVKNRKLSKTGLTVAEYYTKLLGFRNYEKVGKAFFKAVISQDASQFPATVFLKKRPSKNKNFPKSFTFQQGMSTLIDRLLSEENIDFQTDCSILSISKEADTYQIETADNKWQSTKIALATDTQAGSYLLGTINPQLSEWLGKLNYSKLKSISLVFKKEDVSRKPFAGLVTDTNAFFSVVSRDVVANETYRGFTIHAAASHDSQKLVELVCEMVGSKTSCILEQNERNSQLPSLELGHEEWTAELQRILEETKGLYLTGNYFKGLSLEDCVERSFDEAFRFANTLD